MSVTIDPMGRVSMPTPVVPEELRQAREALRRKLEAEQAPPPNGDDSGPTKRISSFKRAICGLISVSPETDDDDVIGLLRTDLAAKGETTTLKAKLNVTTAKLKQFRKTMLLLVAGDLEDVD